MKLRRREPTQRRTEAWPFLYSVVPGRGLVKNSPEKPPARVKLNKPRIRVVKP